MKNKLILLIFVFVLIATNVWTTESITQRINRYSGVNANDLLTYLDSLQGLKSSYADFLINHMSDIDLAVITPFYLDEHLTYAIKSLDLPYVTDVPEEYFQHFVLPLRISQEPFEPWRKDFYEELFPQVANVSTINEAILIADLYYQEGIYFKQTSGRDQAPLTSIKRGYGRCEEMMILQMAVFRAVGIPCRPASAPYWSFTDSNHVWTEVWTPQGWKIVPEAYPAKYRKSSWEVDRAKKAPLITTEIYGTYESSLTLEQSHYDTKLNITDVYSNTVTTLVTVKDENNKPVPNANIHYYATTFGGLFNLYSKKTNENGQVAMDFGETSLFVTAGKEGKTGYGLINTLNGIDSITITISEDTVINANTVLNFPLDASSNKDFGVTEADKRYLDNLTDLANKKRDNRLLGNKKALDFLKNYPLKQKHQDREEYLKKREQYLEKCQELAGNADNWIYIDKKIYQYPDPDLSRKIMIDLMLEWDIKDLIELPDTTSIENLLLTLTESRLYYEDLIDYDNFKSHVLNSPFGSNPFPQTGWQKELSQTTDKLKVKKIDQTVKNIHQWLKENTVFDNNPNWSYFGGSLTPLQYINKKYLLENQQIYLFSALLQNAGIPLRWQGFLEYFNGKEWTEIIWKETDEDDDTPPQNRKLSEFELIINSDGKSLQPTPYANFLIASTSESGYLSNTWFDTYTSGEKFQVKFYQEADQQNYIQGYIRNKNGDANLIIKPIDLDSKTVTLDFVTPKTSSENMITWVDQTRTNLNKLIESKELSQEKALVLVLHQAGNEPQERMLQQLLDKLPDFAKKDVNVIVYSQDRVIASLTKESHSNFSYESGPKIIEEEISLDNYPIIFLLDKSEITTSANGFDLDLINYLHRLVD